MLTSAQTRGGGEELLGPRQWILVSDLSLFDNRYDYSNQELLTDLTHVQEKGRVLDLRDTPFLVKVKAVGILHHTRC